MSGKGKFQVKHQYKDDFPEVQRRLRIKNNVTEACREIAKQRCSDNKLDEWQIKGYSRCLTTSFQRAVKEGKITKRGTARPVGPAPVHGARLLNDEEERC